MTRKRTYYRSRCFATNAFNILRGKIEDMAGWAIVSGNNKTNEAVTRLKRAGQRLRNKSAWWRGSMWRLGSAQEAAGNQKEALDAYIKVTRTATRTLSNTALSNQFIKRLTEIPTGWKGKSAPNLHH
jgi:hypothetical protein